MKSSMQVKALIRNLSRNKKRDAQILMRNYMLERLLERIASSEYKKMFILKGGMLVAAMVGIDNRSTMDMDATIKGYKLSSQSVAKVFDNILSVPIDDGVKFIVKRIEEIHEEAQYEGYHVSLEAILDEMRVPLKVDITAGDAIIPKEVIYRFDLMLEKRSIEILAYNVETVLAEKFKTVVYRGTLNTRMRDFYDIYILAKSQSSNIDNELFKQAIAATAQIRGSTGILKDARNVVMDIRKSQVMKKMWEKYQKDFDYVEEITFEDVMDAIENLWQRT